MMVDKTRQKLAPPSSPGKIEISTPKTPAGASSSPPEEFKTPAGTSPPEELPAGASSEPTEEEILIPELEKTFNEMLTEMQASPQKGGLLSMLTPPPAQQDVPLTAIDEQTKEILLLSDKKETAGEAVKKIEKTMASLSKRMRSGKIASLNDLHEYNRETIARMDRFFKDTTKNDAEKYSTFKSSLQNNSFNGRAFRQAYAMKYAAMGFISELLRRNMPREASTPLRFKATP